MPRARECFPPCEYMEDELEARDWTAADLYGKTWLSNQRVDEILAGAKYTIREAGCLGSLFGVNPLTWLHLQMSYLKCKGEA